MSNPLQMMQIRNRKLGVLIYDSRSATRRSVEECAQAMGATVDEYKAFEAGSSAPTLPQIELLAIFLNVPIEHYWGRQSISSKAAEQSGEDKARMLNLRNKVIGASLRLARSNKNLSLADLASATKLPEEALNNYELGVSAIPVSQLEIIAAAIDAPLTSFYDQHGPIGKWRSQQGTNQRVSNLSPELQQFISKPINQPYLEIALRLSEMPVDKLRSLAESLLEITF